MDKSKHVEMMELVASCEKSLDQVAAMFGKDKETIFKVVTDDYYHSVNGFKSYNVRTLERYSLYLTGMVLANLVTRGLY